MRILQPHLRNNARTNVTAGASSISDGSYAPLFHFGQERIWLPPLFRAFGEPMAGSPLLGFGNDGGQTPYDLRGPLWQRPAGGSSALPAVGAMERSDTFIADPTPIGPDTSPVKLTGPGYNDFLLPIGITEVGQTRNFSVEVQWDANYATSPTAPLPTAILVGKPQMGVAQQARERHRQLRRRRTRSPSRPSPRPRAGCCRSGLPLTTSPGRASSSSTASRSPRKTRYHPHAQA